MDLNLTQSQLNELENVNSMLRDDPGIAEENFEDVTEIQAVEERLPEITTSQEDEVRNAVAAAASFLEEDFEDEGIVGFEIAEVEHQHDDNCDSAAIEALLADSSFEEDESANGSVSRKCEAVSTSKEVDPDETGGTVSDEHAAKFKRNNENGNVMTDTSGDILSSNVACNMVNQVETTASQDPDASLELTKNTKWVRPEVKRFSPFSSPFRFHHFEIDYFLASKPLKSMCSSPTGSPVPIIRMYGISENGNSVCCFVHGFHPFIYVSPPFAFDAAKCRSLKDKLNKMLQILLPKNRFDPKIMSPVMSIEMVEKTSILGYQQRGPTQFLKITFAFPSLVTKLKSALEGGKINLPDVGEAVYDVYESNVTFVQRFMVELNLSGCNWVQLEKMGYRIRNRDVGLNLGLDLTNESIQPVSSCQIELDTNYKSITTLNPFLPLWSHIPTELRMLSFDIECAGRQGIFPEPEIDPVIQISAILSTVNATVKDDPLGQVVFTLDSCASIEGTEVKSFKSESEMLIAFSEMINVTDPDIITGYNILIFDLPYLLNRAKKLGVIDRFHILGRIKNEGVATKTDLSKNAQRGHQKLQENSVSGRVILDLYQVMRREHKLSSYSLNAVSSHFLGDQKDNVPFGVITELQNGNEETRRRLAIYCLKDSLLPLRLVQQLKILINKIELARVTGMLFNALLYSQQENNVFLRLLGKSKEQGFVIPVVDHLLTSNVQQQNEGKRGGDIVFENDYRRIDNDEYENDQEAVTIKPVSGYYDSPVVTLEFDLLYPSIVIARNLCYSTLIAKPGTIGLENVTLVKEEFISPVGVREYYFVQRHVSKGLLPSILEDLFEAKNITKEELMKETNDFKKALLEGRKLALQNTANSIYQFTGAIKTSLLPCKNISTGIEVFGRQIILQAKQNLEMHLSVKNGLTFNAKVIYGDRSSILVAFGQMTVNEAMDLGKKAADIISTNSLIPIKIQLANVYFPYFLMDTKRYAGLCYTDARKVLDCKGVELFKRDKCKLVQETIDKILQILIVNQDPTTAFNYAKAIISKLMNGKIDISQLTFTKELKSLPGKSNHGNNPGTSSSAAAVERRYIQPHEDVARRMKLRDPENAPKLGEQVSYVIVKKRGCGSFSPLYERAEEAAFVLKSQLQIDYQYYFECQLINPLERIFEHIVGAGAARNLRYGEHTKPLIKAKSN